MASECGERIEVDLYHCMHSSMLQHRTHGVPALSSLVFDLDLTVWPDMQCTLNRAR